jgi:transcription elongation GreA/GreB family factor
MREEFEKLAAAGKIEGRHVDALVALATGGCCVHRSWGFGKITAVDLVFGRFTIDFQGKKGHTMDCGFAAESLKPVDKDHILARKATDIDNLRKLAAQSHVELVKLVLNSFGGKATADQVQQVLVPDVIRDDWKKWWETAKRDLKKDGHFQVPSKKTELIVFQAREVSLQDRLMEDFRAAKGLKAHIAVANEIIKNAPDLAANLSAMTGEIISMLNTEISSHQRTQASVALEAVFVRDELRGLAGFPAGEGEVTANDIWAQGAKLGEVMETIPASRHRNALDSFKTANPDKWADILRENLNNVPARICKELAQILIEDGRIDQLKESLARLISQHTASSELLLWIAKDRGDIYADILGPEVFRAMITAMERDQFSEKRSSKLCDYVVADQQLLPELIESADMEVVKDLTRALQFSPCFDDERDRRSLLGRIIKCYPAMQSLISGEQTRQDTSLIVSWDSLQRRRAEYDDLVHRKIPANSKEIAIARSYGDLSENHEFKAAKEMQKVLMHRKHELEVQLSRARGSDFADPKTDAVNIGTVIKVTDLAGGHQETYTVLGAWDGDPDKGILSYLAPMAQAFMNQKIGAEVSFEFENTRKNYRIDAIAAYEPPQSSSAPHF